MRKTPVQQRSRRTVDFILEAAAYILAEEGLEEFTTNRIAERAGVNIASLYQYFPDKTAILEALQSRHMRQPGRDTTDIMHQLRSLPLEKMLRLLVDLAFDEHAANPSMHRAFLRQLPRATRERVENDQPQLAEIAALFEGKTRDGHRQHTFFILRSCLLGIVHDCVCDKPRWLNSPAFREEVVRLLYAYLK